MRWTISSLLSKVLNFFPCLSKLKNQITAQLLCRRLLFACFKSFLLVHKIEGSFEMTNLFCACLDLAISWCFFSLQLPGTQSFGRQIIERIVCLSSSTHWLNVISHILLITALFASCWRVFCFYNGRMTRTYCQRCYVFILGHWSQRIVSTFKQANNWRSSFWRHSVV